MATTATALGGGRGCALLSPNCYLQMPHHRVSRQRVGGGIGSVSQLSLNRETGSGCESTARGSGHAEVLPRDSDQHAKSARGRREWGHARRAWLHASRCLGKEGMGHRRVPGRLQSRHWPPDGGRNQGRRLTLCCFWGSECLKAEGHPGPLMQSNTGREQGRELQLGTKPPACPEPGWGLAQIYLESLGHRVRRQRPGGGCREAKSTSLLREPQGADRHTVGSGEGAERQMWADGG